MLIRFSTTPIKFAIVSIWSFNYLHNITLVLHFFTTQAMYFLSLSIDLENQNKVYNLGSLVRGKDIQSGDLLSFALGLTTLKRGNIEIQILTQRIKTLLKCTCETANIKIKSAVSNHCLRNSISILFFEVGHHCQNHSQKTFHHFAEEERNGLK